MAHRASIPPALSEYTGLSRLLQAELEAARAKLEENEAQVEAFSLCSVLNLCMGLLLWSLFVIFDTHVPFVGGCAAVVGH